MSNPLSSALTWYKQHGPNPLITALGIGGLAYLKGKLFWKPAVETLRSLGRPVGRRYYNNNLAGDPSVQGMGADAAWDSAIDRLKNDSKYRKYVPLAFGLVGAGIPLYMFYEKDKAGKGLLDWNAPHITRNGANLYNPVIPFEKAASLSGGYVDDIKWNDRVYVPTALSLLNDDPLLADQNYTRNLGTAIVTNAAKTQVTNKPTLGGIFDSAVEKIDNKLSFRGLADVGVKSVISNGAARLFTNALGTVCNLSPSMRSTLVDAGTWAGTVKAILD